MPVNITLEMVQQLLEQNASLLKQNEMLTETIAELNQTIQELKEQLNKNSKNSPKRGNAGMEQCGVLPKFKGD